MVLYLRVSTEEQATKGYSLPEQLEACQAKAQELAAKRRAAGDNRPLEVTIFEDTVGGDFLERPALDACRDYVREHKPAYFVCLDPDRFARKLVNQLIVTDEIEKVGTELVFCQHDYQRTAEGQLFYQLRGSIAQYEKAKILERTTRGRRGKMKKGLLASGVTIYGYDYVVGEGALRINETEAPWVRTIFAWAAEHHGPAAIVDRLTALGAPTKSGTRWYSSTVRSILTNPAYIGQLRCNRYDERGITAQRQLPKERRTMSCTSKVRPAGEWIIVPIPAIVEVGVFNAVQQTFRHLKQQAKRGTELLSGLMRCGVCGDVIHYVTHPDGYMLRCINKYPLHRESKRTREKCSAPCVTARIIERKVWAELESWVLDPEALLANIQEANDHPGQDKHLNDLRAEVELLRARLAEVRDEQAEVLMMVARKKVDRVVGERELDKLSAQIAAISSKLTASEEMAAEMQFARERFDQLRSSLQSVHERLACDAADIVTAMRTMPANRRQLFLREFVREVTVSPGRRVEVHPLMPA